MRCHREIDLGSSRKGRLSVSATATLVDGTPGARWAAMGELGRSRPPRRSPARRAVTSSTPSPRAPPCCNQLAARRATTAIAELEALRRCSPSPRRGAATSRARNRGVTGELTAGLLALIASGSPLATSARSAAPRGRPARRRDQLDADPTAAGRARCRPHCRRPPPCDRRARRTRPPGRLAGPAVALVVLSALLACRPGPPP